MLMCSAVAYGKCYENETTLMMGSLVMIFLGLYLKTHKIELTLYEAKKTLSAEKLLYLVVRVMIQ